MLVGGGVLVAGVGAGVEVAVAFAPADVAGAAFVPPDEVDALLPFLLPFSLPLPFDGVGVAAGAGAAAAGWGASACFEPPWPFALPFPCPGTPSGRLPIADEAGSARLAEARRAPAARTGRDLRRALGGVRPMDTGSLSGSPWISPCR